MTTTLEALMAQARDALVNCRVGYDAELCQPVIAALSEALADKAQPAPVAPTDAQPVAFDAEGFRAWVVKNLPDDTIIGSGAWWADHLTAWANRFANRARVAAPVAVPQGWRCFHCAESFTDRDQAALHFGASEHDKPACQISIEHVRWLEAQHRRNADDDSEALRTIGRLVGEHEALRRRAEELGYARGLADAQKHPEDLGLMSAAPTPPAVAPAPAAAPAEGARQPLPERFVRFALRDLKADRRRLEGFLALGNEVDRARETGEWIAALDAYYAANYGATPKDSHEA